MIISDVSKSNYRAALLEGEKCLLHEKSMVNDI